MTHARLSRFDVEDPVHGQVPCAVLAPERHEQTALPVCIFLYGGGGSRESLTSLQPLLEDAWREGKLSPCVVATPDVGPFSFYLDDHKRGYAWESFITQRFVPHLRAADRAAIVGVSMGGYGALKLAFQHPGQFAAVAAVSPMLEPYRERDPDAVPLRNRFFYPPDVPSALLGLQRDAALYQRDHPTARARKHADAIIAHKLAIYIDAAGRDALNAHDGAESLHRELWAQDIPHEYHLRKNADHAGPDQAARLLAALQWVNAELQPPAAPVLTPLEQAWQTWLSQPTESQPTTPLPGESSLFPAYLRALIAPQRKEAIKRDPTLHRHYGVL